MDDCDKQMRARSRSRCRSDDTPFGDDDEPRDSTVVDVSESHRSSVHRVRVLLRKRRRRTVAVRSRSRSQSADAKSSMWRPPADDKRAVEIVKYETVLKEINGT